MSNSFKPGDVVQLNSGGPRMTVSEVDERRVYCEWFIEGEVKRGAFKTATVNLFEKPSSFRGLY